ncbi:MAG: hypothetical protein M3R29_02885 [Verrucomicrobiota bacterium]|nr:hypothetical protein [Verrucomicrobiota bacterium]
MVNSLSTVLVGALLLASARAELQLTPRIDEYELDGAKLKQLAFSDGDKKVNYQSPRGWDYSGSTTRLLLHPPNKTQAEATITRTPFSEPQKFDDESLKKLVAETITLVPNGSENVTVISQEKSPLKINHKETFLVVLGYNLFGQAFNRSVLFLNRGNEQIRFQLSCREADFKELHKAFLGSQYTWQNL